MSWKEDCEAGSLYDDTALEREAEHIRCADLCWEYNRTKPSDMETREKLLRQIFGAKGGGSAPMIQGTVLPQNSDMISLKTALEEFLLSQ